MTNEVKKSIPIQESDKKAIKRKLARNLIQQIIQLYGTIIQKIEHGIGLLWQEYISEQLYSIAKKKVENDIINDLKQLEDWFQNIAENIKDKFNSLSENLMGHFNTIIQSQLQSLDRYVKSPLGFSQAEQLQSNKQRDQQSYDENKQSLSLYETCTESSKQQQTGVVQLKKLCLACQEHLNEAFGYCSKHQYLQHPQQRKISINAKNQQHEFKVYQHENFHLKQSEQQYEYSLQRRNKYDSSKRRKKRIQSQQSEQKQEQYQGSFYQVFFGLIEAFQM